MEVRGAVGLAVGEYQGAKTSTASIGIVITAFPDWLPVRYWGPDQVLFLEPPLIYRYRFLRDDSRLYFSNWVGMNTTRLLIPDPRERSIWADDLEIVTEEGVTYTLDTPGALVQ